MNMADLAKIVEDLSALTVLEAADLSKMLEEKWGVSAAAAVAAAPAAAAAGPAAEEQTEFDVILTGDGGRSEEHTSELQSLMRISYAVFCLKKKKHNKTQQEYHTHTVHIICTSRPTSTHTPDVSYSTHTELIVQI